MNPVENDSAERLARAHASLLTDLRTLEDEIRPAARTGLGELQARLAATRSHVREHFRFEERGGYLTGVRQCEPRLEHAIRELAQEHRRLLQDIDAIIAGARTAVQVDEPLAEAVHDWIRQLRHHEARENDLVQDALIPDLAAED